MLHSFYPHNFANVFRHYKYMKACLSGQLVPLSSMDIPDLVDHRYFYDEFDPARSGFVGYYTCGVSRNTVAASLLTNKVYFDTDFLRSLPKYIASHALLGL
jgi:hypothetical protein